MAYPLYVLDRSARKSKEPFLQYEIHDALIMAGVIEGMEIDDFFRDMGGGVFRYFAPTDDAHPLGIFRLRFRPNTQDVGPGMDAEAQRAARWAKTLSEI